MQTEKTFQKGPAARSPGNGPGKQPYGILQSFQNYGEQPVLQDVTAEYGKGGICFFTGPSGSGKTLKNKYLYFMEFYDIIVK